MNHSKKLNLHKNETYKEYNVPERVGIIKFLELGEVKQLMTVQLDLPVEQKARDLLLFACFTGMRYSDIRALKKADIKQHQFEGVDTVFHAAHIRQLKTSRDIVVPLLPEALSLIREYENDPGEFTFPQLALQTVNNALKEVGKKAGLNSLQKIEVWRGSVKDTTYVEKWRVLSTHMGRRTFVTISATKGLPINVVASITGQNPKTTMLHYMGVVNVEKFRELTTKVKFQ
jgi:integrase